MLDSNLRAPEVSLPTATDCQSTAGVNNQTTIDDGRRLIDGIVNSNEASVITLAQIELNTRIQKNKTFKSYPEFIDNYEAYCRETFQMFTTTQSKTIVINDSESGEGSDEDNNKLQKESHSTERPYKKKIFQCIRYINYNFSFYRFYRFHISHRLKKKLFN